MAQAPDLRVIADGDSHRVYRQGDRVTGRVVLVLEQEQHIKELRVNFVGACITKTTRPVYISSSDGESGLSNREFEEQVRLFNLDRTMVLDKSMAATKHSWIFEFSFPRLTEGRFSKWAHGSKYFKEPHALPPSFNVYTNVPGGQAMVSYYVQARLTLPRESSTRKATQYLPYHPPTPENTPLEARITSRVLYNQAWKPAKDTRTAVDRMFTKVSRKSKDGSKWPKIIPTLHFPEKVTPGQHIPLHISLSNVAGGEQPEVVCDSLTVSISTHTTSMCGNPWTQPEDVVCKHVTCISKQEMNMPLSFDSSTRLTTNFRLIDDAECVPTFKTYTITRHYNMTIVVCLKLPLSDQKFTIRCTYPLEILPRISLEELRMRGVAVAEDDSEYDPLPLYRARAHSMELAPAYETLYSPSPTPSTEAMLDYFGTRSPTPTSSLSRASSGMSTPSSMSSTSSSELEEPIFEARRSKAEVVIT